MLTFGSHSRLGKISSQAAAIETTASTISEVSREPKLLKNSKQRQSKIDQQASKISSLEVQNQKLTHLLEPKFLVDTITMAVASNLNINVGNNPQKVTQVVIPENHTWGNQDPQNSLRGLMDNWIQSFPAGIAKTPAT